MPIPPTQYPDKTCPVCGVTFNRRRFGKRLEDPARYLSRQTCSQRCGNSRESIQADSHRWRARQIERAEECRQCGATEKLHVHHRDRDVTNNDPGNLETLCASCHLKLHWREDRAERMESISARTRRPSSDGRRYLLGKLPAQLNPGGTGSRA